MGGRPNLGPVADISGWASSTVNRCPSLAGITAVASPMTPPRHTTIERETAQVVSQGREEP